jgi:hypothetical protein
VFVRIYWHIYEEYISGLLWIPKGKELIKSPFNTLNPFLLILLGIFRRKCQGSNIWPIIPQIKIKEPQICEKQGDI